ncbi:hypothetical protein F5B19DRAFT_489974 [Rostrohypoxylon terebratum]|nr:hypothetical protein F5B19DRAFT_489974 [Rostrohypoxylon terebratum]
MPRKLGNIRQYLDTFGLKHNGLKLKYSATRAMLEVWGGTAVTRWVVEDKVTDLFTAMVEEFDKYDDQVSVLHISHQDDFFDAVSRRILWLRYLDREVLGEFIHYCLDARKNYLAGVFNPRFPPPGDGSAARAIHEFLFLYEQEEKREKMREAKATEKADANTRMNEDSQGKRDEDTQGKQDRTTSSKENTTSITEHDFTTILMRTEGFVWDSLTFTIHIKSALAEAWSSIANLNPRKKTVDLFRYMSIEWRSYDDHMSISQLRFQHKFLEAISARVRWLKNFPKDILCEFILVVIAAREQHIIRRSQKPTAKFRPDSVLANKVQQFMDLYKIRQGKKLLTFQETPKTLEIESQVNAVNTDQDDIRLRGEDIALALNTKHKTDSTKGKQEVKRIGGSNKKDSGLPLRPKSMFTDKIQKERMAKIVKGKADGSKKDGGGSRMVGAPNSPFLMRKDRLPAYLVSQGEKKPKESLDLPGFNSRLKFDD